MAARKKGKKRVKVAKRQVVNKDTGSVEWENIPQYLTPSAVATRQKTASRSFSSGLWRRPFSGTHGSVNKGGYRVFQPIDPYRMSERKEFRAAMDNPYVYRASRIQTTFVTGHGYTTEVVPRIEEDLDDKQLIEWKKTKKFKVPYLDAELTPDQIKDRIDKMANDMDLENNIFNGYLLSLEQGRCAIAMLPLDREELANGEKGDWHLPEKFALIRPEFTMRPIVDTENYGELMGVQVVGIESDVRDNVLSSDRMLYIEHGFNNELFSDHYGDSKIARISDIGNTLNIILNQDYERGAEFTWHQPKVFQVPIPPQNFGKEDEILGDFIRKNANAKGQDIAVSASIKKDERGVELISSTTNTGGVGQLETMRTGLIKAIITAFGIPGFMLSEGDIGKLGGNANIEEVDAYLNTEIKPEMLKMEDTIEKQYYDRILLILFKQDNIKDVPIKIKHKFNKPRLATLINPQMYQVLDDMVLKGRIEESGMREILGLDEAEKETISKGGDTTPGRTTWIQNPLGLRYDAAGRPGWNIPRSDWFNQSVPDWNGPTGDVKGAMPMGWSQVDEATWLDPDKQIWKRQKSHIMRDATSEDDE